MTSSAWEQARDMAEKHSNSVFVRLANDGDKVVGVFCGEPYAREVVWTGEKYLDADNDQAEKYLKKGRQANLRVAMNLYLPGEDKLKVYEMGVVVFKDVLKLREKYGLEEWAFEIERHGGKGDNKTHYTILPEHKLDADTQKKIAVLELYDLAKVTRRGGDDDDGGEPDFDSYGPPLPADVVTEMVPRLKALPRDALDRFLHKFGVQRVKEIKADDQAAALEALTALEAEQAPPPPAEIDPFA